jgi:HEAT repeat protein
MDSFDATVRADAAAALGRLSPIRNRHMNTFLTSLNQSDPAVRRQALTDMHDMVTMLNPVVESLYIGSRDIDPRVRRASLASLDLISGELTRPIPGLESLKNSGPQADKAGVCLTDIQLLMAKIGRALEGRVDDEEQDIRETAETLLVRLGFLAAAPVPESEVAPVACPVLAEALAPEETDTETLDFDLDEADQEAVTVSENGPTIEFVEMDALLTQMESFDLSTRKFALISIGALADRELKDIPGQVDSIKDGDIGIRTETTRTIGSRALKMERTILSLGRSMADVDRDIRINTARTLGKMLEPLSVALVPLYNTPREIEDTLNKENVVPDPMVQLNLDQFKDATHDAIGSINRLLIHGVPMLANGLTDKDEAVRGASALALKQIIPPSVLFEGEKNRVPQVWQEFFVTLGEDQHDLYVRLLSNDLVGRSVNAARQAARILAGMGPSARKSLPALIDVVSDRTNRRVHYHYVKIEAMNAIGSMGAEAIRAVPVLIDQLSDVRFDIRRQAVIALGQIGSPGTASVLLDRYEKDHSSVVREAAMDALATVDPVDCLDRVYPLLLNGLKDDSGEKRLRAFRILAGYEAKNGGRGWIKWKPSDHPVLGYRVCSDAECVETGPVSAFRLGDFQKKVSITDTVRVHAIQETGTTPMEFVFVDITAILQKSVELEKDSDIRLEKEKMLLPMLKELEQKRSTDS